MKRRMVKREERRAASCGPAVSGTAMSGTRLQALLEKAGEDRAEKNHEDRGEDEEEQWTKHFDRSFVGEFLGTGEAPQTDLISLYAQYRADTDTQLVGLHEGIHY